MDILKKVFPLSFKSADIAYFIISIIVYVLAGTIIGVINGILAIIPIIGFILAAAFELVSAIVGIYCLAGIVISILVFLKVM